MTLLLDCSCRLSLDALALTRLCSSASLTLTRLQLPLTRLQLPPAPLTGFSTASDLMAAALPPPSGLISWGSSQKDMDGLPTVFLR